MEGMFQALLANTSIVPDPEEQESPHLIRNEDSTSGLGVMEEDPEEAISAPDAPKMDDAELLEFVQWIRARAQDASLENREVMRKAWELYDCEYDFSDKQSWQSQRVPPRVFMMVEQSASTLKKALFVAPESWFEVETYDPKKKPKAAIAKRAVLFWTKRSNLKDVFEEALKFGLLSNFMAIKVFPDEDIRRVPGPGGWKTEHRWKLGLKAVDPRRLDLDPSGLNKFIGEEIEISYPRFVQLCREGKFYEDLPEKIPPVGPPSSKSDTTDYETQKSKGVTTSTAAVPTVKLYRLRGDFWNKDGETVYENHVVTLVNYEHLAHDPMPNPEDHGQFPIVTSGLVLVPGSVFHKSIITMILPVVEMMIEYLNLLMDGHLLSLLPQGEVNPRLLHDVQQLGEGITPMKLWIRSLEADYIPGAEGSPVIRFDAVQPPSPHAWTMYEALDREGQLGSGITESMLAVPRLRGRVSAMEVAQKAAQTNLLFDSMISGIESRLLSKVLELMYYSVLQYQVQQDDWEFAWEVISDPKEVQEFMEMTPQERFDYLAGDFRFVVNGISALLARREELEKILIALKYGAQIPGAQSWNWVKIGEKFFSALGWDPSELILPQFQNPALQGMMPGMQVPPNQGQGPVPAGMTPIAPGAGMPGVPGGMMPGGGPAPGMGPGMMQGAPMGNMTLGA